jgi:hypothetical protein
MLTNFMQAYVRKQAAVHCDTKLNYKSQSEDAVWRVCQSVRLQFLFKKEATDIEYRSGRNTTSWVVMKGTG